MALSTADLRHSTRGRRICSFVVAGLYGIACLFLMLVNIGQVANINELNDWYFFRFDVSNVIPASIPNAALVNSIAATIGLHDFYDVSMWNYCEGYYSEGGVTDCSTPTLLYWFNPAAIIAEQLARGASLQLPEEVLGYLDILRTASQIMFGCFFAATIACFVAACLAPMAVYSKRATIPLALFGTATAVAAALGAGISTGIWTVFRNTLQQVSAEINIVPTLGIKMFAFQWTGAAAAVLAALIQLGLMCCGVSRHQAKVRNSVMTERSHMEPSESL